MKNAEPYLIFDGGCTEAFTFYETVFDAKIAFVRFYKDMPSGAGEVAEADRERVLHILLPISKAVSLMGADSRAETVSCPKSGNIGIVQ